MAGPARPSRMSSFDTSIVVKFQDILLTREREPVVTEPLLVKPENADDRLAEFDLTAADIHDHVVRAGLQAAGGVSPLAPPGAGGRHAHDGYVVGLRGLLLPRGWVSVQHDNVARTVHRSKQIAIVVASGNEFTGQLGGANYLTTAWPKGSRALAGAILPRQDGFEILDGSDFDWGVDGVENAEWELWYLLIHPTDEEVRLELSTPTRRDRSGYMRGWTQRIIIPSYVPGQVHLDQREDGDDDDRGEPDVPVVRR